jgi:hypothetical protein
MEKNVDHLTCDVAVIGGSLGGVAAALAAVESGASVILTEATPWIGGQVTNQAVAPLDEHALVETVPATRSYAAFRAAVRRHYQDTYGAPASMPDGSPLNPGNGWVSRLCFEPRVGLQVLENMLHPHVESGRLQILPRTRPVAVQGDPTHLQAVDVVSPTRHYRLSAHYFLDATDLGDLLPLADVPYVTGAEAKEDTGEVYASPDGPHPERIQSLTFCFLVEFRPGENHTIKKPSGYARFRDRQPYSLTLYNREGQAIHYNFFTATPERPLPFWTYRRVLDGSFLRPGGGLNDVALINWHGNDYHWDSPIDQPPARQTAILDEARRLSLGFLYWLQTEAPHDDGKGHGYPELKLLPNAVGTRSGLAMAPYVREARRIRGLYRITAQDILVETNPGKRQAAFADSVGIGWYAMDLHPAVGDPTSMYAPTLPFQIPLGALIPLECDNLLAACKNINTTHLSNGAYRLQPVEWSIGEAAGSFAAYCWRKGLKPHRIYAEAERLSEFQAYLRQRGVLTEWPENALASLPARA